jgi:hypothetical protein
VATVAVAVVTAVVVARGDAGPGVTGCGSFCFVCPDWLGAGGCCPLSFFDCPGGVDGAGWLVPVAAGPWEVVAVCGGGASCVTASGPFFFVCPGGAETTGRAAVVVVTWVCVVGAGAVAAAA